MDLNHVRTRIHFLYRQFLYSAGNPLPRNSTGDVVVVECNRYGLRAVVSSEACSYLIGEKDKYLGSVPFDTDGDDIPNVIADIWLSSLFG
jgi:hypothetical protein